MDIQFDIADYKLNVRVAGVLLKNEKVLLHKVEGDKFWGLIGGKVKINETSEQAILREFSEELKVDLSIKRLLWIVENFFNFNNVKFHEYIFIYLLEDNKNQVFKEEKCFFEMEKKKLLFKWFEKNKLSKINIKPSFLNYELENIPSSIKHIIHHDFKME